MHALEVFKDLDPFFHLPPGQLEPAATWWREKYIFKHFERKHVHMVMVLIWYETRNLSNYDEIDEIHKY